MFNWLDGGPDDEVEALAAWDLLGQVWAFKGVIIQAEKTAPTHIRTRKGMFGDEHPDTLTT